MFKSLKEILFSSHDKLSIERLEVCASCVFFINNKCTRCTCSGAGKIKDINSRCPNNMWRDGWGDQIDVSISNLNNIEHAPDITYWDSISSSWITKENQINSI